METFVQDIRYALRGLLKSPRFTAAALLTVAAGIGANTAIFCLINAVLLRPAPGVEAPGRLVSVFRMQKNDEFDVLGFPDYADYRDRNQSFAGLAAFCDTAVSLNEGTAERLIGSVVTGNYFSLLGLRAERGRVILPEDDTEGTQHPVAVLSYGLWQRKFAADPSVLGKKIQLNGFPFTVMGIAPPQFAGTVTGEPVDVWVPMSMLDEAMPRVVGHHFFEERAWGWLRVFGRLKPGLTFEQAEVEMKGIAAQLALAYPETNAGRTVALVRGVGLDPDDATRLSRFLGLLFGGVALLLLIACTNVAGLLLVRAAGRQREIAVRLALGAGRARLIRQLLTEGLLLALAGGVLGLLLAPWTLAGAIRLAQSSSFLQHVDVSPDVRVLVFALITSMVSGTLFALAPALRATSPDLVEALKQGTPGSGRRSTLQRTLAAGQVAISFVLLMGAGLLLRTMRRILTEDPGFETRNILLGSINLTNQGYSPERGGIFFRQLLERLRAAPGVTSASLAMTVPPSAFSGRVSIFYPGQEPPQEVLRGHEFELGLRVDINSIAPDYFRTMGIPILQGRDFSVRDGEGVQQRDQDGNLLDAGGGNVNAPGVVILNHKLAQRLWPGENAVGKRISWPSVIGPPRPPLEVVGVAADSKYRSLVAGAPLLMYVSLFQNYDGRPTIILRTASVPKEFSTALRQTVAGLDKNLPVFGIRTMTQQIEFSVWQQRMAASLVTAFGVLALVLATVGLYAVVAHSVAQRTQEMGVRMALGAQRRDVLRLVVGEGMKLALAGWMAGAVAALALTRFLEGMLYGVQPADAATLAGVFLLQGLVTLVAAYFPARRATRVDPIVALRYE